MSVPGVPPPPDAVELDVWEKNNEGALERFFRGTQRGTEVSVEIVGFQSADGSVARRTIVVAEQELDATGVQELINDLVAARDELDRLSGSSVRKPAAVVR